MKKRYYKKGNYRNGYLGRLSLCSLELSIGAGKGAWKEKAVSKLE